MWQIFASASARFSLSNMKPVRITALKQWAVWTNKYKMSAWPEITQKADDRTQVAPTLHHCPIHYTVLPPVISATSSSSI